MTWVLKSLRLTLMAYLAMVWTTGWMLAPTSRALTPARRRRRTPRALLPSGVRAKSPGTFRLDQPGRGWQRGPPSAGQPFSGIGQELGGQGQGRRTRERFSRGPWSTRPADSRLPCPRWRRTQTQSRDLARYPKPVPAWGLRAPRARPPWSGYPPLRILRRGGTTRRCKSRAKLRPPAGSAAAGGTGRPAPASSTRGGIERMARRGPLARRSATIRHIRCARSGLRGCGRHC